MSYRVVYERDAESGWWLARVPEVRGCHTQGRTVDEARRRIREALGLFVEDAETVSLEDDVKMPAGAKRAVTQYFNLRRQAEEQERAVSEAQKSALSALVQEPLRLSIRDSAAVLGLSHQRVHQLLAGQRQYRGKRARRRG